MVGQTKQIGIMKAGGATYRQLVTMYLSGVTALSVISLAAAIPLGYKTAVLYNTFIANELNFKVLNSTIPVWLNMVVIITLLLLPLSNALLPIRSRCKLSVLQAINFQRTNSLSSIFGGASRLPYWLQIGFSNAFRNQSGAILTIFSLMLGLALFMTSLNLRSSITNTFVLNLKNQKFDFTVSLDKPYPIERIKSIIKQSSGIKAAEYWMTGAMRLLKNRGENPIDLMGFQDKTQLLRFNVIAGKIPDSWTENIVVNPVFIADNHLAVGDSVTSSINGKPKIWHIAAVVKDLGEAKAYTSRSILEQLYNVKDVTSEIKIQTNREMQQADAQSLLLDVENTLKKNGVGIAGSTNQGIVMQILNAHIMVITLFLMVMALLVLIVGGIGLITIMNINILERKREIGIMRAIGGSAASINKVLFAELFMLGVISWLLGWAISLPMSKIISSFFGELIIHNELDFSAAPSGIWISLAAVILILILSAIIPIRNASKIAVHTALTDN